MFFVSFSVERTLDGKQKDDIPGKSIDLGNRPFYFVFK